MRQDEKRQKKKKKVKHLQAGPPSVWMRGLFFLGRDRTMMKIHLNRRWFTKK